METEIKKDILNKKGIFLVALTVFLVVLTILTIVITFNKIESRKYIGQEVKNTITISAQGEIFSQPNLAIINFSVISEAKSVEEAMQSNTSKMNAIIGFMKEEGEIEERDLRTIGFRIAPLYEWQNNNNTLPTIYPPINENNKKRVLVGYEVHQTLEVRIRDISKVGMIIEGGTRLGANQIDALQFTINNEEELKSQARGLAIEKAKNQAKIIAEQLGIELVRIVNFQENYYHPFDLISPGFTREAAAPEIMPGEKATQVTVHITYEIR